LLPCEAAKVTGKLDCNGLGIEDGSPLRYFTGITELDIRHNPLSGASLQLPAGLEVFSAGGTQMGTLPGLPATLRELDLNEAQVSALPATLPPNLRYLDCAYNGLTSLPALPASLEHLACGYNKLTALPALPPKLKILTCTSNQLAKLPKLPETLQTLKAKNNPGLTCLPNLPAQMSYLETGFGKVVCQ